MQPEAEEPLLTRHHFVLTDRSVCQQKNIAAQLLTFLWLWKTFTRGGVTSLRCRVESVGDVTVGNTHFLKKERAKEGEGDFFPTRRECREAFPLHNMATLEINE